MHFQCAFRVPCVTVYLMSMQGVPVPHSQLQRSHMAGGGDTHVGIINRIIIIIIRIINNLLVY